MNPMHGDKALVMCSDSLSHTSTDTGTNRHRQGKRAHFHLDLVELPQQHRDWL